MDKHPLVREILYTKEDIEKTTKKLAEKIELFFRQQSKTSGELVLLGLLKGCIPFMAKFMEYFKYDCETEYMVVSTYFGSLKSSGIPKITLDLNISVKDKTVLILEDIIESGVTLKYIKEYLQLKGAKEVKVATLLDKKINRKVEFQPDWYGFSVKKGFLVGFGLDYQEKLRNLPYIGYLDEKKAKEWVWEKEVK